ncbi:Alpha/Beta hydrolase protein [Mycena rosella]|uniref:Alpha/Beta hydrolase protein n=1 Tax=Mycena rosella TaxID=1033263 RepID=A0AAD7C349_MYCRO|nr:Alpha/Beta hydrolase protein [Mycena rosella]
MLSSTLLLFAILHLPIALGASEFDWQKHKASTKLTWAPCYDGFECTRLQVPLDYTAPKNGTASIAVVRFRSTSPKSEYRGPLLFNPGGPGGSGVDAVVGAGPAFAAVFGPEFDIVGFDPRGVSYSTPAISFFKTDVERELLIPTVPNIVYPSLNASSNTLSQEWARWQLVGQLAVARDEGGYLQHMTTDNIARDMLQITEAFGYAKLQYWGISYGSVLGATFASLFPDKIGRLIIDGVEDMDGYYSGNTTFEMRDTDKAMQTFFDGCAAAGPADCAFHAPSASQISENLAALTSAIRDQPVPVITADSHGIVDFVVLRNAILNALFSPYDSFGVLAAGLAALAGGDAAPIYALNSVPTFECQYNASVLPFHSNNLESYLTIAGGDAAAVNESIPQLQQFYENATKVSNFADLLASTRVLYSGWKIHRAGRFQGPVGAKNTSFPLLIVGNTVDPATPLAGAVKAVQAFPRSALLTLNAVGHTSLTAPSLCLYGYFRQYFINGTLPQPGTVCSVDATLFAPSSGNATERRDLETERLLEAGRTIGAVVRRGASRRV